MMEQQTGTFAFSLRIISHLRKINICDSPVQWHNAISLMDVYHNDCSRGNALKMFVLKMVFITECIFFL